MSTVEIELHDGDMRRAVATAHKRNGIKRTYGIERLGTYNGKESTVNMHLMAAWGEIAVEYCYPGTIIDESVSVRGNRKGNIILPNGLRAFACVRGKRDWDLALKTNTMSGFHGKIGFLIWPGKSTSSLKLEIMGWISRAEFEEVHRVSEYRPREQRWYVGVRQLHSMSEVPQLWTKPVPIVQAALW